MSVISDKYGRRFRTLRVSLVQHCNMGCVYCVDDSTNASSGALVQPLSAEDLLVMIGRLHSLLDLETIRLTGGEPLLYRELASLVAGLRVMGIPQIRLTTNGFLLERQAASLRSAGLSSVNVSLDAIDEDIFFRMSRRRQAARVIGGIDAALAAGLKVKLNSVMMKGMNDSQLLPIMDLAFSRGIPVRFLEVMTMGHLYQHPGAYLLTQQEILERISQRFTLTPLDRLASATARYWKTESGGVVGIIANESEPFCGDCNRLRLDSSGNIYGCLSSDHPVPMDMAASDEVWVNRLEVALAQKQALRFTGSSLSMLHIGG